MPSPVPLLGRAAVVLLLVGGLAACSSPDPEPYATVEAASTPSPTPTPTVDDEPVVLAALQRYWDAEVAAQAGNTDPAVFAGVAEGPLVEDSLATARQLQSVGLARQGQPTLSKQTVTVDGDTATVLVCVDNSTWTIPGQTVAEGVSLMVPTSVSFRRVGEDWVVTATAVAPPEFTC